MFIHPDVKAHGMSTNLLLALYIADQLWKEIFDEELVLRHVCNGRHSVGSLHYIGNAADLRTWGIDAELACVELRKRLGSEYDVILEDDHIHIEYQPK